MRTCPYVVTDYAGIADLLRGLGASGVRTVILDLPNEEEEFGHLDQALALARGKEHIR
jgi:hypothetical protein